MVNVNHVARSETDEAIRVVNGGPSESLTQSWLAEMIRAATSAKYSEILKTDMPCGGVHYHALCRHVLQTRGAVLGLSKSDLPVSATVDLLVQLEDLAAIGDGYLIPRESRVVIFTKTWGRVAGGLPFSSSEVADDEVAVMSTNTVGRIVKLGRQFDVSGLAVEHSEFFLWGKQPFDQILAGLSARLPDRAAPEPAHRSVLFYNANAHWSRTRRDRWQLDAPRRAFAIAKTRTLPVHYLVCFTGGANSKQWYSVDRDDARKWLLLAERCCGAQNVLSTRIEGNVMRVRLPDMFPQSWTITLLACASAITRTENGWDVLIEHDVLPLFRSVLESANAHIR